MHFQRKLLLTIAATAILYLGYCFWVGWEDVYNAFRNFYWPLLPVCLGLAFMNYAIRFLKWHYYLRLLKIDLPYGLSFRVFLAGMVMAATPGKFGEVFKSYLLKTLNGTPLSKSAPIVLAERLTDFIAFVLLALLGVTLLPNGPLVFAVSIGVIAAALILAGWRSFALGFITWLDRWPPLARHTDKLRTAYESVYIMIAPKPLILATGVSVFSWWFECFAFFLIAYGFGAPIPLLDATFIYAFGTILGALLMTPGGIGPAEVTIGGLLTLLHGLSVEVAGAATLLIRVCTLWFAVAIGLFVLMTSASRFSRGVEEMEKGE